jgi:hypothetical protein
LIIIYDVQERNCRLTEIGLTWGRDCCVVEGKLTVAMLLAVAVSGYYELPVIEVIDAA